MITSMSGAQQHTDRQPPLFVPTLPARPEMERAFFESDASYDGLFVTGVRTTGIFCRPSCRARKPLIQNIEFFGTVREALFAGYRPCLRCWPLVGDAVKKGAKVLTGGGIDPAGPLFYRPSVVGDVTPGMEIVREEIFGPVAALVRFDTEAEAIKLANDTPFGLAAYLFSQSLSRAWRVAEQLDAGMVGVNEGIFSNEVVPFGGVKESGLGREGAAEGLDEYLEIKYICLGAIDA